MSYDFPGSPGTDSTTAGEVDTSPGFTGNYAHVNDSTADG